MKRPFCGIVLFFFSLCCIWAGTTSVSKELPLSDESKAMIRAELTTCFGLTNNSMDLIILREEWNENTEYKETAQYLEIKGHGKAIRYVSFLVQPESKKGYGRLVLGNSVWNFNPVKRTFTLSFDDTIELGSLFLGDESKQEIIGYFQGTCNGFAAHMVRIHDKETSVVLELWIDADTGLQLMLDRYHGDHVLTSRLEFLSYVQLPSGTFFASETKTWSYLQPSAIWRDRLIDIREEDVPDDYFTKAYVERVCR